MKMMMIATTTTAMMTMAMIYNDVMCLSVYLYLSVHVLICTFFTSLILLTVSTFHTDILVRIAQQDTEEGFSARYVKCGSDCV